MNPANENIKKLLWKSKMTQEQLTKKVGYKDRSSINKIVNGEIEVPLNKLIKFAEVFNVSVAQLMDLNLLNDNNENTFDLQNMNELYSNIKIRRKKLKITQEELAAKMGLKSGVSINRIEKGYVELSQSRLEELARHLDTTVEKLMGFGTTENTLAKLIILAGLPGSGRSYMVHKMVENNPNITMIKRYSTRNAWIPECENADSIEGATKEDIQKCDIRGFGFGVEYGCKSEDIDTAISQGKLPIIVGGVALVAPLRKIYPNSLSIFLMADPAMQKTVMLRQGHTLETIHERMEYQNSIIFDAFSTSLHDFIVINNYNKVAEEVLYDIIANGYADANIKGAISLKSLKV